ncbi:hypothetical protein IS513_10770 [Proteus mirabilis]|uniref:hypothetical protein n=1 Tax=Proteus mirabilis TaxID=584 RepID=UPI001ADA4A92|nr:hypothetical protein [Proteus mirabilis]MBO8260450.1 hypothetical protein [Proteus mirabilis]MBO8267306.1 hypothetical protein [Proteus mirabilis]MBO8269393.1 hypothetical protein [Proteus mirabilis]MBO8271904.1 hypothetical protein [Proteus mirabilis]MBO8275545.1 hypothetical protein [Proteus mirabilis]
MKIYVYASKTTPSYWEFIHRGIRIRSENFQNRPEAIDNLEETLLTLDSLSVEHKNDSALLFFEFKSNGNNWSWSALSKISGECIELETQNNIRSHEQALITAGWFKDNVIHAPIVDSNGIELSSLCFSRMFSERFGIGDIHPMSKLIK